jgi:hypothetical protein
MTTLDYLDFELSIANGADDVYAVAVLHSPAGEAQTRLRWPWSRPEFERLQGEVQAILVGAGSATADALARQVGDQLFQALFAGDVGYCFEASKATARSQSKGLRLKLRIEPPLLQGAPWELLYDGRAAEFLALSRWTPLVRYLAVPQPIQALPARPPLRILGMAASPPDLPPIDLQAEQERLADALAPLRRQGLVAIEWLPGQSWRALHSALQGGDWHIFHYVGHAAYDPGAGEGILLLTDDGGTLHPLRSSELARLLHDQPLLRLAVLNACDGARGDEQQAFSSLAAALVRRGLPAVIAMQAPITDQAAVEFSHSFYGALAAGLPIDAATGAARQALSLSRPHSLEWLTPVLYLRAPDGRLWTAGQSPGQSAQPAGDRPVSQPPARQESQIHNSIQIGGNATDSTVVIGGNVTGMGATNPRTQWTAADQAAVEEQIGQLRFALSTLRGRINSGTSQLAELQLRLLQAELSKGGSGQAPDGATISGVGDWLLEHVPDLAEPLGRCLRSPAMQKALTAAGAQTLGWMRRRFGG